MMTSMNTIPRRPNTLRGGYRAADHFFAALGAFLILVGGWVLLAYAIAVGCDAIGGAR